MIEKWSEKGFKYRRELGVMDGTLKPFVILVDVTFEVGGGLVIEVEIREDVAFAEGASAGAKDRFVGWRYFCDLLCTASRYFIIITSPSMMSLTSSGGTVCPLSRS